MIAIVYSFLMQWSVKKDVLIEDLLDRSSRLLAQWNLEPVGIVSLMAQATNNFSNIASATEQMTATITGIVKQANTRVGWISRAVEEQSTATNEVAKNIDEASAGFYSANQMMEENDEGFKQVAHDICELEETATGVKIMEGTAGCTTLRRLPGNRRWSLWGARR